MDEGCMSVPYIQRMNKHSTSPPSSPSTTPTKEATMSNLFSMLSIPDAKNLARRGSAPISLIDARKQDRRGSGLFSLADPQKHARRGSGHFKRDSGMSHLTNLLNKENSDSEPPLIAIAPVLANKEEVEKMEKEKDQETLVIRFNSAYFLCKKERPFSEFSSLLELQEKNGVKNKLTYRDERAAAIFADCIGETLKSPLTETLAGVKHFSLLCDASSENGTVKNELVYVMYLNRFGHAQVDFLSMERPIFTDGSGLLECITASLEAVGVTNLKEKLYAINLDGNQTKSYGRADEAGELLKKDCPWLVEMKYFGYRVEETLKKILKMSCFKDVDTMLEDMYDLHQQVNCKRMNGFRDLEEALELCFSKDVECEGGCGWMQGTSKALKWIIDNYGAYILHTEKVLVKSGRCERRTELQQKHKQWKEGRYLITISLYLDVLTLIHKLGLAEHAEENDPVKNITRIRDFNAILSKFQPGNRDSGTERDCMQHYNRLMKDVKGNEDSPTYQNIVLKDFKKSETLPRIETSSSKTSRKANIVRKDFKKSEAEILEDVRTIIAAISEDFTERCRKFNEHPVYKHLVTILDCRKWPSKENLTAFGDNEMRELSDHFQEFLAGNSDKVLAQWLTLKQQIEPILERQPKPYYLEVWERVMTSQELQESHACALTLIELLLITPFTGFLKFQRMCSRLQRSKNDWRKKLHRTQLEHLLRIGEEGPSIIEFNPHHAVERWAQKKL